jgi:serine/threonine-protein kinase BUR1
MSPPAPVAEEPEEGEVTSSGSASRTNPVRTFTERPSKRQRCEPVHRSREEEQKAYGRIFIGCGRQDDYDATTKLGEGTFGYVH